MASIARDGLDFDKIYPIGSIYISASSTNPHDLFGGVWEQIKGRFLIGTGEVENNSTNYWGSIKGGFNMPPGETGGEDLHQLTTNELPKNIGHLNALSWASNNWMTNGAFSVEQKHKDRTSPGGSDWGDALYTLSGGGSSHNNMPPYLAVYMWKRIG